MAGRFGVENNLQATQWKSKRCCKMLFSLLAHEWNMCQSVCAQSHNTGAKSWKFPPEQTHLWHLGSEVDLLQVHWSWWEVVQHLAQEYPVSEGLCQVEDGRGGPHDPVVRGQDLTVYQPPPALSPLLHIDSGDSPHKVTESSRWLTAGLERRFTAHEQALRAVPYLMSLSSTISAIIRQFRQRNSVAVGHRTIYPSPAHDSPAVYTTWKWWGLERD